MRTLIALTVLLLPIHGGPQKVLPHSFFESWEFVTEFHASAFYAADNDEDFHRILRGEFRSGDTPLQQAKKVNPKNMNESMNLVVVNADEQLLLVQYFLRSESGSVTTYFYCLNNSDSTWHLVPPELFPYGRKGRDENIEVLGGYFYSQHFFRYLIYTAYPVMTSQK